MCSKGIDTRGPIWPLTSMSASLAWLVTGSEYDYVCDPPPWGVTKTCRPDTLTNRWDNGAK